MPMFHHELKTWPEPFNAIADGSKTHEVRKTDRDFQVGQRLLLREWDDFIKQYTGRQEMVEITYISDPGTFGLPDDVAVMSRRRAT